LATGVNPETPVRIIAQNDPIDPCALIHVNISIVTLDFNVNTG